MLDGALHSTAAAGASLEQEKHCSSPLPSFIQFLSSFLPPTALDVEEPQQEAEAHLNKACNIFFPDLSSWIGSTQAQAAADQEMQQQQQEKQHPQGLQQQKDDEEPVPPLAIGNVLKKALSVPDPSTGAAAAAVAEEAVETLNLLALLMSGREDIAQARLYLLAAKEAYRVLEPFCPVPPSPSTPTAAAAATGDKKEKENTEKEEEIANSTAAGESARSNSIPNPNSRFRRLIDDHHTHSLYYLAQIYGQLKQADASAWYCYQTLAKQVEWEEGRLDVWGWVSNCMSLIDYLVGVRGDREAAARCLHACSVLLTRDKEGEEGWAGQEKSMFIRADIHRRWAALYCSTLQEAAERVEEEETGAARMERREESAISVAFVVHFPTLETALAGGNSAAPPASLPQPKAINTFAEARFVFLLAQKHLDAALEFFKLDGHVTDHVHLMRAVSRLYRDLSLFETDEKRRQAMSLRRANALQPLVDQLNPRAYVGLSKMLLFELGEVYLTLLEVKSARIEQKLKGGRGRERGKGGACMPNKADGEKCDEYCRLAIGAFEGFVALYQKDPEGGREGGKAVVWDLPSKDDFKPVFRALFHLARLYGQMSVYGGPGEGAHKERIDGNKKSLEAYEWIREFAAEQMERLWGRDEEGMEEGKEMYAEELGVCNEMVRMLPEKIARMHYQKVAF